MVLSSASLALRRVLVQADEGQNGAHDDDETHDVDDVVHGNLLADVGRIAIDGRDEV